MESSRPSVASSGNPSDPLQAGGSGPAPPTFSGGVRRAEAEGVPREVQAGSILPDLLSGLFWDCPFGELRLPDDRSFIIGRVLTSGSWSQIGWLRQQVGDDSLRQWIGACEGRPLDPPQLRFWELILDLPSWQVDRWMVSRSQNVWDRRMCQEMGPEEAGPEEMGS